jgi:hypothetical protein
MQMAIAVSFHTGRFCFCSTSLLLPQFSQIIYAALFMRPASAPMLSTFPQSTAHKTPGMVRPLGRLFQARPRRATTSPFPAPDFPVASLPPSSGAVRSPSVAFLKAPSPKLLLPPFLAPDLPFLQAPAQKTPAPARRKSGSPACVPKQPGDEHPLRGRPSPGCRFRFSLAFIPKHRGELSVLYPPRAAQPSSPAYSSGNVAAAPIVPPPRRRASPSTKKLGGVCSRRSFRFASLPLVSNPSLNGSKGEEQPPPRGRGPQGRKKRKPPCLRFFPFWAASCRPRRHITAAGRTSPARTCVFPTCPAHQPPRLTQV